MSKKIGAKVGRMKKHEKIYSLNFVRILGVILECEQYFWQIAGNERNGWIGWNVWFLGIFGNVNRGGV